MALCSQMQRKMANKKRRRQKPAANFSEWATTIMLNILSALISAALIKLLGLNQSSKVGPSCGSAPILLLYPKI